MSQPSGAAVNLKSVQRGKCKITATRNGKRYELGQSNSGLWNAIKLWLNTKRWNLSTYMIVWSFKLIAPLEVKEDGIGSNEPR